MQDCDTLMLRKTITRVTSVITQHHANCFGQNPYTLAAFTTNTAAREKDTDIKDSHDEMWNDSYVRSLPGLRLSGGPVQSVQDVLAKGGEQAVCHLRGKTYQLSITTKYRQNVLL